MAAIQWKCPCCEMTVAAGETHICPVADRHRYDQTDPGWHLTPSRKYRLLRSMIRQARPPGLEALQ